MGVPSSWWRESIQIGKEHEMRCAPRTKFQAGLWLAQGRVSSSFQCLFLESNIGAGNANREKSTLKAGTLLPGMRNDPVTEELSHRTEARALFLRNYVNSTAWWVARQDQMNYRQNWGWTNQVKVTSARSVQGLWDRETSSAIKLKIMSEG